MTHDDSDTFRFIGGLREIAAIRDRHRQGPSRPRSHGRPYSKPKRTRKIGARGRRAACSRQPTPRYRKPVLPHGVERDQVGAGSDSPDVPKEKDEVRTAYRRGRYQRSGRNRERVTPDRYVPDASCRMCGGDVLRCNGRLSGAPLPCRMLNGYTEDVDVFCFHGFVCTLQMRWVLTSGGASDQHVVSARGRSGV